VSDKLIVNIADMKYANSGETIITYALGSCIGLAAYDPVANAGALLHFMLPDSKIDLRKAQERPFMFADSGLIQTFLKLKSLGCQSKRLIVKIAGGSNIMDSKGTFNIGKRNFLTIKKLLWKYNIIIKGSDIGGSISRNMTLNLSTNVVSVRYSGNKEEIAL
jgi:chemotaxis protein CheD